MIGCAGSLESSLQSIPSIVKTSSLNSLSCNQNLNSLIQALDDLAFVSIVHAVVIDLGIQIQTDHVGSGSLAGLYNVNIGNHINSVHFAVDLSFERVPALSIAGPCSLVLSAPPPVVGSIVTARDLYCSGILVGGIAIGVAVPMQNIGVSGFTLGLTIIGELGDCDERTDVSIALTGIGNGDDLVDVVLASRVAVAILHRGGRHDRHQGLILLKIIAVAILLVLFDLHVSDGHDVDVLVGIGEVCHGCADDSGDCQNNDQAQCQEFLLHSDTSFLHKNMFLCIAFRASVFFGQTGNQKVLRPALWRGSVPFDCRPPVRWEAVCFLFRRGANLANYSGITGELCTELAVGGKLYDVFGGDLTERGIQRGLSI